MSKNKNAAWLGKLGGKSTSDAKRNAAKLNGAKGGRPRKTIADGFGSEWSARCHDCGKLAMQVVRPGKAQCARCG